MPWPEPDATDLYAVIRRVRPLFRRLNDAVEGALDGTGITIPMRGVLETLHDHGPLPVPEIARRLQVQRQFVQLTVDAIERAGLVRRHANPAHRRSPLIALTEPGTAAFTALRAREDAVIARAARGLNAGDVAATLRVMDHLIDRFTPKPDRGDAG